MNQPDQTAKGFFGALFDFSFKSYVTPKIIKVVFAVVIIVSALGALIIVIAGFGRSVALGIVFLIIIGPLVFLFYVIIARVYLEVVMAVFTIAENSTRLVQAGSPGAGGSSQPSPFGPPPAPSPPSFGQRQTQPPPSFGQRPAQPPSSGFGPPPVPPSGATTPPPPSDPPAPPWLPPPADR